MIEYENEDAERESKKATAQMKTNRKVNLKRQPLSVPRWWSLVMIGLSLVLVAGISIGYTLYKDHQRAVAEERARTQLAQQERENDRRWCLLLNTLDRAYSSNRPTTELGRQVADAISDLTVELECAVK